MAKIVAPELKKVRRSCTLSPALLARIREYRADTRNFIGPDGLKQKQPGFTAVVEMALELFLAEHIDINQIDFGEEAKEETKEEAKEEAKEGY